MCGKPGDASLRLTERRGLWLTSRLLRSVLLPSTIKGKSEGSLGSPWIKNSFLHPSRAEKLALDVTSNTSTQQWVPLYRGVPRDWNLSVPAVSQIWHTHSGIHEINHPIWHECLVPGCVGARFTAKCTGAQVNYLQRDCVPIYADCFREEVGPHSGPVHVGEAVIHVSVHDGGFSHPK